MPKDILLYGSINEYTALYFFDQIKEATKEDADAELVMRINVTGGSPEYGMSIIEKIQELSSQISIKAAGAIHSMGIFLMVFVDQVRVEVTDNISGVFHRAAYPSWVESSTDFPGSIYAEILTKINKNLEKAFRARVDVELFEALPQMKSKNLTIKDIFALETRLEVLLSASDLKKVGLAGKINKITPTKSAEVKSQIDAFSKCRSLDEFRLAAESIDPKEPKNTPMTLAEFKAQYPALYAELYNLGLVAGVAQEKDRVEACLVFAEVDLVGVTKAIKEGKAMTQAQMAEFSLKAASNKKLAEVEKDTKETGKVAGTVEDPAAQVKPAAEIQKEKNLTDFEKAVQAASKKSKSPEATKLGF